jgi:hypothetical protein
MASNNSNDIYDVITDKRIVPYASNGTGTIITQGTGVVGTGTLFEKEMPVGSYLVDLAHNEYRLVVRLSTTDANTIAELDKPFTTDLGSSTPSIIHSKFAKPFEISVIIPVLNSSGSSNASGFIINNRTATAKYFPVGVPYTPSKANRERSAVNDFIKPLIVDFSGTQGIVTVLY